MSLLRATGLLAALLPATWHASSTTHTQDRPATTTAVVRPSAAPAQRAPSLVAAARRQIGVTVLYDPAYVEISYPGGDVDPRRGVCTDVVVRALRSQGLDLQQAIHQDMQLDFEAYPQEWGLKRPNRSIDHRRVPNQMRWFERQGWSRPLSNRATDYAAGDIVAWKLTSGPLHIGLVSDRRIASGTPLVIHNIGSGTREDNLLFQHPIIGHYRQPAHARQSPIQAQP